MLTSTVPLDTTRYANGRILRHRTTGRYWNGAAFVAETNSEARLLSDSEVMVLKTQHDAIEERVVTIVGEICAACNHTGKVGYFFNIRHGNTMMECEMVVNVEPDVYIACKWRELDGNIEMYRSEKRGEYPTAYKVVSNFAELVDVILLWKRQD